MTSSTRKRQDPKKPLNGRRVLNRQRTRLALMWDFQNVPLDADDAFDAWFYMDKFLDIAFPNVGEWELKVYASWEHREAVKDLRDLEMIEPGSNADTRVEQDIRRFCSLPSSSVWWSKDQRPDPKDTVLVLVSKDGDFSDLLYEAAQSGVDVYLWAPSGCSQDLIGAMRQDNIIPWNHPCIMVSEDNLNRLHR